jgi:hypothetical protein
MFERVEALNFARALCTRYTCASNGRGCVPKHGRRRFALASNLS